MVQIIIHIAVLVLAILHKRPQVVVHLMNFIVIIITFFVCRDGLLLCLLLYVVLADLTLIIVIMRCGFSLQLCIM